MYHIVLAGQCLAQSPRTVSEDAYYEAFAITPFAGVRKATRAVVSMFRWIPTLRAGRSRDR